MFSWQPDACRSVLLNRLLSQSIGALQDAVKHQIQQLHQETDNPAQQQVVSLALSESDRMPFGSNANDHEGALNVAYVTSEWALVVCGTTDTC